MLCSFNTRLRTKKWYEPFDRHCISINQFCQYILVVDISSKSYSKKCIFSFQEAITTINFDEYLKKEILYHPLRNNFNAANRLFALWESIDRQWFVLASQFACCDPILLNIEYYTTWCDVISDSVIKENLNPIINNRMTTVEAQRLTGLDKLTGHRRNERCLTLQARLTCSSIVNAKSLVDSVINCSSGWSMSVPLKLTMGFIDDCSLWDVHDLTTGFLREWVQFDTSGLYLIIS